MKHSNKDTGLANGVTHNQQQVVNEKQKSTALYERCDREKALYRCDIG